MRNSAESLCDYLMFQLHYKLHAPISWSVFGKDPCWDESHFEGVAKLSLSFKTCPEKFCLAPGLNWHLEIF